MKIGVLPNKVLHQGSIGEINYLVIEPDNPSDDLVITQAEDNEGNILFKRKCSFESSLTSFARMFGDFNQLISDPSGLGEKETGPTNNALSAINDEGSEVNKLKRRIKLKKRVMEDNSKETNLTNQKNFGHSGRDEFKGEDGFSKAEGRESEGTRPSRSMGEDSIDVMENPEEYKTMYNNENPSFSMTPQESEDKVKYRKYKLKIRRSQDSAYNNPVHVLDRETLTMKKMKIRRL